MFKNVGERSAAKNYLPVNLLSVVSKVFEKLINHRIVDHLQKYGLLSDFQYGLGLLDQLQMLWQLSLSDRVARAFNRSWATQAVALDKYKAFDWVWHTGLFRRLSLIEFKVRYLALFLLFLIRDGFKWFWMGSLPKNFQLMVEFVKTSFMVLHFSCYTWMTFLKMKNKTSQVFHEVAAAHN